jgi:hypothetical protein
MKITLRNGPHRVGTLSLCFKTDVQSASENDLQFLDPYNGQCPQKTPSSQYWTFLTHLQNHNKYLDSLKINYIPIVPVSVNRLESNTETNIKKKYCVDMYIADHSGRVV